MNHGHRTLERALPMGVLRISSRTKLTDTKYLAATSGIGSGTSRRPGGGTYFPGSPRWITVGVGVGL